MLATNSCHITEHAFDSFDDCRFDLDKASIFLDWPDVLPLPASALQCEINNTLICLHHVTLHYWVKTLNVSNCFDFICTFVALMQLFCY